MTIWGDAPVRVSGTVSRGQHATLASNGESCVGGLASGSVQLGLFMQPGVAGDLVPPSSTRPCATKRADSPTP